MEREFSGHFCPRTPWSKNNVCKLKTDFLENVRRQLIQGKQSFKAFIQKLLINFDGRLLFTFNKKLSKNVDPNFSKIVKSVDLTPSFS